MIYSRLALKSGFIQRTHPYIALARLDKPWGMVLLAWPTLSALSLSQSSFDPVIWCVFTIGIVLTRSAGCVINDYADIWLDKHVTRTQNRPLAQGTLTQWQALVFLALLLSLSASLLYFLPPRAWLCAVLSVLLMGVYPYTKRYMRAPQLFLGIAFSQGIPMAYISQGHVIDAQAVIFYAITVLWVVIYDTVYALTDSEDDIRMRAGSLAITLGEHAVSCIQYGYVLLMGLWVIWGVYSKMHMIYYLMMLLCGYNLNQQMLYVRKNQPFQAFLLNQSAGIYVLIGICLGGL